MAACMNDFVSRQPLYETEHNGSKLREIMGARGKGTPSRDPDQKKVQLDKG